MKILSSNLTSGPNFSATVERPISGLLLYVEPTTVGGIGAEFYDSAISVSMNIRDGKELKIGNAIPFYQWVALGIAQGVDQFNEVHKIAGVTTQNYSCYYLPFTKDLSLAASMMADEYISIDFHDFPNRDIPFEVYGVEAPGRTGSVLRLDKFQVFDGQTEKVLENAMDVHTIVCPRVQPQIGIATNFESIRLNSANGSSSTFEALEVMHLSSAWARGLLIRKDGRMQHEYPLLPTQDAVSIEYYVPAGNAFTFVNVATQRYTNNGERDIILTTEE